MSDDCDLSNSVKEVVKNRRNYHDDEFDDDTSDEMTLCLFCFIDFRDVSTLQAHLASQRHLSLNQMLTVEFEMMPKCFCLQCKTENKLSFQFVHPCVSEIAKNNNRMEKIAFSYGSPLTCILCTDKVNVSFYHNMIHIITSHGFDGKIVRRGKNPCPFCHSLFNTDERSSIEYHAVKEHMPEIYMEYLKEMQPEGNNLTVSKNSFSCKIPTKMYDRWFQKGRKKNHCAENFSHLTSLMTHIQSTHSPIPNRPLVLPLGSNPCLNCLVPFPNSSALREHCDRKHDLLNRQRANYCKSQYKLTTTLSELTCKFCWHKYKTIFHLQVHIQASHQKCWRICGLCDREYCKPNEVRSAKLVFMEIVAHERHHVKRLEEHCESMLKICQGEMKSFRVAPPEENISTYFSFINFEEAKRKRIVVKKDYVKSFAEIGERNRQVQNELLIMGKLIT